MTLAPADLGCDYSYSRPSLAEAVKAGGRFVLRYSAGAASAPSHPSHQANAGKLITPAEFAALVKAGLDVIANSEWYTTRITEGAEAGRQDAAADMALWRSCGLHKGASIYVSWDAPPNTYQWPSVDAYLTAYQQTLAGYYHVDAYAGTPYLRHALAKGLIRYGWRPNAGSWSGDGLPYQPDVSTPAKRAALTAEAAKATPAHIWQTGNYWFGKTADENLLVRTPCGSHLQNATPAPAPTPTPTPIKELDMSNSFGYAIDPNTLPPNVGGNCYWKEPGQKPQGPISGNGIVAMARAVGQPGVTTLLASLPLVELADHEALGGTAPAPVAKP